MGVGVRSSPGLLMHPWRNWKPHGAKNPNRKGTGPNPVGCTMMSQIGVIGRRFG